MLKHLVAFFIRLLLRLRYRIHFYGLEKVHRGHGCLVLPNHPAQIDPVIISCFLWNSLHLRPVVLEKYYYLPLVHFFMKMVRAIPMPEMGVESGPYKKRRTEQAMLEIIRILKQGDNVLMYPSGRLMRSGRERLGGASGVYRIIQEFPEVSIILIRTRGLYGSSFSRAISGRTSPDLMKTLIAAGFTLLKNFFIFTPRREVTVTICEPGEELPRKSDLVTFNRWLERWYNEGGEENPTLVSRSFWRHDVQPLAEVKQEAVEAVNIPPEIQSKVMAKLAEYSGMRLEDMRAELRLGDDLGLDSLKLAELLGWLEDEFEASGLEPAELETVGAVMRAAGGGRTATIVELPAAPSRWNTGMMTRPAPRLFRGQTIPEVFLNCSAALRRFPAVADELRGVLTYGQLRAAVLFFARQIARLEGEKVGILLPSSSAATMVILASMVAGKIPVMLNWTSGRKNIEQAINTCDIRAVLTAEGFLDRLSSDLNYLDDKYVFLENVKTRAGLRAKLSALIHSYLKTSAVLMRYGISRVKRQDPAVILFTSGSETAPKGVPLSHGNILSNIQAVMEIFHLRNDDALCSFLPPFHSFGLTVASLLPGLIGLRAFYYPNPMDGVRIASACEKYRLTLMAGTPTFLRSILISGGKEKLGSLRYLIAGAEKTPPELFSLVKSFDLPLELLEGYGITECSPIVAVNTPGSEQRGVGKPVSSVEVMIVDHETLRPLPPGECGLILIRGESVFSGYLGGAANPFVTVNGESWYNSGDLGYLSQGCLFIAGRLKRFVKIAGEMISLPALEEVLRAKWSMPDGSPALALIAREAPGQRPALYLCASVNIAVEEANQILKNAGFPRIARIDKVVQVDQIPLLGSGKVDIQSLSARVGQII